MKRENTIRTTKRNGRQREKLEGRRGIKSQKRYRKTEHPTNKVLIKTRKENKVFQITIRLVKELMINTNNNKICMKQRK